MRSILLSSAPTKRETTCAYNPRPNVRLEIQQSRANAPPHAITEPVDALEHLAVGVAPRLTLLPAGDANGEHAAPEAGAALAVALDADPRPGVCDLGRLDDPALRAFAEVAGVGVVVVRGCYLALR